jgi:hypothetical protein
VRRRRLGVKLAGRKILQSAAVPEGGKNFRRRRLDAEWRCAKLRRMQAEPGRRPVLLVLALAALSGDPGWLAPGMSYTGATVSPACWIPRNRASSQA